MLILSANQRAVLFDKDEINIKSHINNTFKLSRANKNNNTQKMRVENVDTNSLFCRIPIK